jgi:hypothetical protein
VTANEQATTREEGRARATARVDLHARVDLYEVVETARVIAVPMRDHGEVELSEIHALGLYVMGKDLGIVAGVDGSLPEPILDRLAALRGSRTAALW